MVSKGQDRTKTRIVSVEVLRIVAMLGIAVFHTFQPWFEYVCTGPATPEALLWRPSMLGTLGTIDQLGAWGNHVFIMISGCFLLPAAVKDARAGERNTHDAVRRIEQVLLVVVPYAMVALLAGMVLPDITSASVHSFRWLTRGLQFIWVYLTLIVLCPHLGRVLARLKYPGSVLAILTVIVYAINFYIAFVSPGEASRSLFEWRKLMSGVTYALSFVIGGWLSHKRFPLSYSGAFLLASIALTVFVETYASTRIDLTLLDALSYKSTSPFACAMATSCLAFALAFPTDMKSQNTRIARVVTTATSGMLGFYVLQALFSSGWHQVSYGILHVILQQHGQMAFIAVGIAFSFVFFAVLDLIDILVRQPLVRPFVHGS